MKVEKTKSNLRIYSDYYEIFAEILSHNEVYIEGLDGANLTSEAIYTLIDWLQENTKRPNKKYRITYTTEKYPSYVPENSIIEEVYA